MMRIAIPVAQGYLTQHFGHCGGFDVFEITDDKAIAKKEHIAAPPHEPGLLPRFLAEKGATHVIAGGMGSRACDLLVERGITVITGAPAERSERIVADYLAGVLATGANGCDH
jgi:predicted Fe-Mo cluster-binding NifX family protein